VTAAVVTLALCLAACMPAIIWLAHRLNKALDERNAAIDQKRAEYEQAERYIEERDDLTRRCAALDELNRALKQRLAASDLALTQAEERFRDAVLERAQSGDAAVAAHELDKLLQMPIVSTAAKAGAGTGGHTP